METLPQDLPLVLSDFTAYHENSQGDFTLFVYPFRFRRTMPRQPKLRNKKVGASVYWYTKTGGDTYFGSVDVVPYKEARQLFNDHVMILAEKGPSTNSDVQTVGDLVVVFLEWIEKKRSQQTFTAGRLKKVPDRLDPDISERPGAARCTHSDTRHRSVPILRMNTA